MKQKHNHGRKFDLRIDLTNFWISKFIFLTEHILGLSFLIWGILGSGIS